MFLSHSVLSAPGIRPWLLGHLGRIPFYGLHSVISLTATAGFVWAYVRFGSGSMLYAPLPGARILALTVMPIALLLIVGRITTRTGDAHAPAAPEGIYRLCRHPGSVGLLLWTLVHLMNLAEDRNVIVFGTMAAICLAALVKNEAVRRAADKRGVPCYMETTSIIPFAAILTGRQRLVVSEIGWPRLGLAILLYGAILWGHPLVLGVDPLAPYR
jgi:uncharacterized membrane protein